MADSELARQFKSLIVCDFCGYECNNEALYDEHLQSHIVGCCTTSSDFVKEESCNNDGDDISRRALSEVEDARLGVGLEDSASGSGTRFVAADPVTLKSTSHLDINESKLVLPENRNTPYAYNCAVCGVGFKTADLYQRHVRTHVQKIDAALSRQGIYPEIVPVSIVPVGPGKLPEIITCKNSTIDIKVPTEVVKPKLLGGNNPVQKTYNDKLSDTVEALRLSLLKQSTPVAAESTTEVYEVSSQEEEDFLQTAGEVSVSTTNSFERTLERSDGKRDGSTARKRKQELVSSARELIPSKTVVQDGNVLYCYNSDSNDSDATLKVESDVESQSADYQPSKEWTKVDNTASLSEDDSNSCGYYENNASIINDKNTYKLLREHSYPILQATSSVNKAPQRPPGITQKNVIPVGNYKPNCKVAVYSPPSKTYLCNICGIKFSVYKNLERHLKAHRKQKRRKIDEHYATVCSKDENVVKDSPTTIAENFGININSKMLDTIRHNHSGRKETQIFNVPRKIASQVSSKSLHWVSNKVPQQQQQRTPSSVLNIKCFCGRKFSSVPSFRKHMQCHVHGPSRVNNQEDDVANDDCSQIKYNVEDTVESVYNVLRNDLGNPSLPSFVTEKAPRPKPAPEHKKVICPECGISFSSARYVKNHIGSKRCLSQVRHNWQVSQKNGNLNEPSYCSDCGVIVPNYAPKVLARHITNVPDKVKCRFCVLKLDRVRNAVSRKDLTDKVLESFPQNQKGSVPVNISSKGEGKESVKVEAAVFEKPSVHCLMKADAEEFLITDASGIVKTEAKNVPTGSSESQQDPTLIQLSNAVALASTLESKDVARVVQITPSTSSVNISAASVSGFGAETCKEYKCDRCGLVYLSQWSYSRHREKFCASKSNADSSVAQSANSSEQQQNITDSTAVVKSDSTCEVAEAANLIDSVVTRRDVSEEEDDEEDSLLEYSVGYSFMGIDLGDTSDDETLSKENNSSDEKDNSDSDNDPDLYLCNFCSNRSTSPLSYKEHLQTHVAMIQASDDHTSFYCEKCASHTFNILHQCESVSETRTSTCGICLRQFQSIESAKMHALKCHDNTTLKFCIGCYWGFGSAEELKEHVTECADCVIRSSPRSSKHTVSHERILETDMLPSKSKSDKPDLSLSAEVPLPTPSGQFETTADKQEGTPSSQIAEVDKLHKPMSAPATVRVGLEPARISSSSNCFSNTVKVMVESSSVESHRTPEVASSLSTDLKHVISSFTNTWALKKPLSYADILGVKSDLPELATLPTLKCDLIDDHSKLRETKSQGCVETWEDKSRVLSTLSSQTSIKELEFKEIPNKFTGFQELGTDDTLSLPCYSPEVISSPAKCADIQSEIEDIISKLPVLKSETAVDSEIGSVDVAEFCPNSAAVANSACSPLGVASMNTSTTQKNTLNEQAMASPVRTHSDSEDEGVCTPCSQSSAALDSSPCSPKVVAIRKSIRQTTVPSSHACSPLEPRNRSTSPVLRKRKLSKIIPESPDVPSDEDISVTHYQGSVSHQQDISKSVQPLTLNQENSTNGIKLKLVRITSPQKEGIRLPSNFIAYKLVSGAPTIASTTASSNASGSVPSDVLSANVQGAAIDSTMRTKSLASIRVVSDTNSSTGMTGRRPLLEHLFSEIKPSNIGTISTEPDIPAPLAGSVSPLVATQHTPTSPPGNLPFVSKAKRKCTARKSTSRFAQSVKNGVAGQKSTVGTTCDWGILFTDKNGVRHNLPKCRVELFKLDDLPVQVSCLKSATLPVENKKVCTPEVLPTPKQVENRSLVSTSSPNTPQTPTLAISKILSSIKRFIKPSPLKEELVSNSAIATKSPFSTTDSLPSSTKNLKCADISHERTCKSPVMPVSHVQNTIHVNKTSSLAGFPIESTSPAESASLYPVFRRRACRTYSRMSQPSPCRLTRSTSKTNLVNSSPQKLESLSADNFQKSNTPTRDGDINKILSAFKNLIDKHDSGSPSSTPQ